MSPKDHKLHLAKLVKTYRASSSQTDEIVQRLFSSLNCPRSLTCYLLYKYGEHNQLLELEADPMHYNNAFAFRDAYCATKLLSKSVFLETGIDKKAVALKKFHQYEELCRQTNRRFQNLGLDPSYSGVNASLLSVMTRKIEKILGDFSGDEFIDQANWGPGVTTLLKGEEVSAYNKFLSERGITRDLYALVGDWFPIAYPLWYRHLNDASQMAATEHCCSPRGLEDVFVPQTGNNIVTVAKTSKTDRVIAVEPGLNLWFQKGLGSMIRRRLRRQGVDLTDQGRNQRLSFVASKRGDLATVDFSSASDSISREVIREVLPHKWYLLLDATRSKLGVLDTSVVRWEKFSSMGNGFTFELESLIFYTAALAVCDYLRVGCGDVSVYGDDVIIPSECYELFSSFTEFLGFKVNPSKSYSSGPFRESCGSHYYEGIDVTPIFLKERVDNVESVYKLANSVRNLAHRRNAYFGCDARFHRCWTNLRSRVPKDLRIGTSRQLGDAGFAVNFDEACPPLARAGNHFPLIASSVKNYEGYEGFLAYGLVNLGINRVSDHPAMLIARMKVPSMEEYGNTYPLRGRTRIRFQRILVPRWYNYGSWF